MTDRSLADHCNWIVVCLTALVSVLQPSNVQGEQESMYPLLERPREGVRQPARVSVFVSPIMTYDLPNTQISFRLTLRNPSDETVHIRDPLQSLVMQANTADSRPVDIPIDAPGFLYKPESSKYSSRIHLVSASVVRSVDMFLRDLYEIGPQSSLDLVFECDPLVGERILAALGGADKSYIDLRIGLVLFNPRDVQDSRSFRSEFFRIPIPTP